MKKCLTVLVTLLVVILNLSGCEKETTKIGILIYDENDTFVSELTGNVTENLPSNVSYEIAYASNSQSIQNQQLLSFLDEGVDVLLINPVDRLAASTLVLKCQKEGVPVIFFNREPLESDIKDATNSYYVGANTDNLGMKQAEMASGLFGPPDDLLSMYDKNEDGIIQTVIIKGEQGHQDAEKRTKNSIEHLYELGYQVDLLATRVSNWRRSEGYEGMRELDLEFGDTIELVLSNNDDMAIGAIDYYLETGEFSPYKGNSYRQPTVIIGVDGTEAGLDAIRDGLMYGTVLNDSSKQSQAIAKLVEYMISNKEMSDFPFEIENGHYIYIDGEIILKTDTK